MCRLEGRSPEFIDSRMCSQVQFLQTELLMIYLARLDAVVISFAVNFETSEDLQIGC